ncbi:MAG TPA: hypothetical protein VNA12_00320 [Mycobacteriales bacterium]|nr:hypothetical protein [Mycobacteriales bacterium]
MDTDPSGPGPRPPARPVFVDASGRRGRWTRRASWALTSLLVGYLLLVLAALVGPSQLSGLTLPGLGPVLPGPGAGELADGTGTGTRDDPQAVLEPTARPAPRATPPPPRRSPSAPPASAATVSAAPAPSAPGRSASAPGRVAPTAGTTPTASPSPSPDGPPRSSRAPSPRPRPSRSR